MPGGRPFGEPNVAGFRLGRIAMTGRRLLADHLDLARGGVVNEFHPVRRRGNLRQVFLLHQLVEVLRETVVVVNEHPEYARMLGYEPEELHETNAPTTIVLLAEPV